MNATTDTNTARIDIFERARNHERRQLVELAREHDMLPFYRQVEGHAAPTVRMEGSERLMFGSNNYLGLTTHPVVQRAAREALDRFGTALTGARLQNGTISLHRELEAEIADWMGTEDSLVFTTGYQANLGCISALLSPTDTAVLDSADHASIFDGWKLSGARLRPYRHNRMDRLERSLQGAVRDGAGVLVVVDGVFSMEGGLPDLHTIAELSRRYGARLMVDEAHAVGVLGSRGAGTADLLGVENRVDLRMGTFSKSLASCGGFIAGPADMIDYLRIFSRPFLFTVSAVPAAVGAALAAIRIVRSDEGQELAGRLLANAAYLHRGLESLGYRVFPPTPLPGGGTLVTPIVPAIIGDDTLTGVVWNALWEEGLYANAALHPAVPPGESLIRCSVMATHTRSHLDRALEIFARVQRRLPGLLTPEDGVAV
jgi:8-amino-7-oxononanoate synthase